MNLPVPQYSAAITPRAVVTAGPSPLPGSADRRYLDDVRELAAIGGYTVDALAAHLGISRSIAAGRVARLVTIGWVRRGRAGVIEVTT